MKDLMSKIIVSGGECTNSSWTPHPSFEGVYMRNILGGKDTGGRISCHIVRLEPNAELKAHVHEGKSEIHEIISGTGLMMIDNKDFSYSPGSVCYIPDNTIHSVKAGDNGLIILAKFSPAIN